MEALVAIACSGLALTVIEGGLTINDEIRLIWKRPLSFTAKASYFATRYFAVLGHLLDTSLFLFLLITKGHVPAGFCRPLIIYQTIVIYAFLTIVDCVLLMQVLGLYARNCRMQAALAVFFVLKLATSVVGAYYKIPHPGHTFQQRICISGVVTVGHLIYIPSEAIAMVLLLSLIYNKHFRTRRSGLGKIPLLTIVTRDSTLVILVRLSAVATSIAALDSGQMFLVPMFPLLMQMLSSGCCRSILNIQRMQKVSHEVSLSADYELSTVGTTWTGHTQLQSTPASSSFSISTMANSRESKLYPSSFTNTAGSSMDSPVTILSVK